MGKSLTLLDYQKKYEKDLHNISVLEFSGDNIVMYCNNCHHKFLVLKRNAYKFRNCIYCGDGVSYPNKFLRNFIGQLPVEQYDFEYNPKWASKKFYDAHFFYDNQDYVVEMDGLQHKYRPFYSTIKEQEENDKLKDNLAKQNNHIMIRIDAIESSMEYIKNQIENSLFNDLFDLSCIDWNECAINAVSSLVIKVCKYFNNHICNVLDISNYFHISKHSVLDYLKKGCELGLISNDYKNKLKSIKSIKSQNTNIKKNQTKPFKAYDINTGQCIGIYYSLSQGQDELRKIYNNNKIDKRKISRILNKKGNSHYNLTFFYIDEKPNIDEIKRKKTKPIQIEVYDNNKLIGKYLSISDSIKDLNNKYKDIEFKDKDIRVAMLRGYKYRGLKFIRLN